MCTVTWSLREDGYDLLFNRDELRSRKRAVPPKRGQLNGVEYIAPIDRDAGGTWIGVNECGLTLCLLNYYKHRPNKSKGFRFTSRGLFLLSLLDCTNLETVKKRLQRADVSHLRPFVVLAVDNNCFPISLTWTGAEVRRQFDSPVRPPLSSSSFNTDAVIENRMQVFTRFSSPEDDKCDVDELLQYHKSHIPKRGPYSVCMHRDDAKTVSFTRIKATRKTVELGYAAGSPCRSRIAEPVELAMRD